uniref:RNA-directed DNA polymerase n=1 Tax=Anopheles atroparvus TaxID=41427 RepID=A0AAG5DPC1_ANOAO
KNKDFLILYDENSKLSFTHKIKHNIRTVDNIPIHTKSYKYPQIFEDEVKQQVKKMLRDGIIKESISPYTSPVWVVPKKTDSSGKKKFRLVIDYRKLNEKTINDKYPIPDITDILDKLGRACYFSTVDLVSGFHQIQLANEDMEKTAFSVNSGKYEFTRMPFGLKNAPATFQRVMDCILREHLGKFCLVYMDDIIIFSPSFQEHKVHISKIFRKLKEANLKIQHEKCEFFRKEVQFLGHTVTEHGVKPNNDKIEVIRSWPIPKTEKDIRQFLGILGYYRRFIKDFAKLVKPLTNLLRKEIEIEMTPEIIKCFEKCKKILTLDPILIYPDFSKEFILTTDASDFAIGAVLSQGPIGQDRPVAYASRTLNKTEERYSTTEKELLAIIWAVKHFRPYLYGRKFKLYTDHQPLTFSLTNANNKIIRWRLMLEEFDYEIIYKPGKQNVIADALSQSDDMTAHSADTSDDYFIPCTEKPLNVFRNQIILKISHIETEAYEQIFPKYHRHTVVKATYTEEAIVDLFKRYLNPKGTNGLLLPISLTQLVQETFRKHFSSNRLFKVFISETLLRDLRLDNEQDDVVREAHNHGHRGTKENKMQILQTYFFPQIDRIVKIFVKSCEICKKAKYNRKPPKLIQKSTTGDKPFNRVHIDIFFLQGKKWLTIVDSFSKFANAIPLETRTIIDIKQAFSEHIRQFGRPETIICDQEPSFRSIDFIGFLDDLGIAIHFASSSNSNGIIERFHSTLIEIFRTTKPKYSELTLEEHVNVAIDIYNNTFHEATKAKPREVVFNTTNIEFNKRQAKLEKLNQDRNDPVRLETGENVIIKNSQRLTKDKNPFKITTVKTDNILTFKDKNNVKIHKNRIKN